jgi:LuxR family maltose regulon positive regulatory protein
MLGVVMAEDATMQSMMSGEVKGEPMAALLREARARNVMPASVDTLLAAFPAPDRSAPHTHKPAEHAPLNGSLSEREHEVLSLLAAGLSNQAIADTLVLAVGTVKRHLHLEPAATSADYTA